MLVLKGNIPRFPWEPSTTMLTYRLNSTTEQTASNRNRPHHTDRSGRRAQPAPHPGSAPNLRSPRRAPKVLYFADLLITSEPHLNAVLHDETPGHV